MKKGYIIVKTKQGIEMAKMVKAVEALCIRLETIGLCRPGLGLDGANESVFEFCSEITTTLDEMSKLFEVLPGQPNADFYRQVVRDSNYGKRRRLIMRTLSGEKLFRSTISIDRMCTVVGMLARQQLITGEQAKEFFTRVEKILKGLTELRNDMGKLLANAETAVDF